MARAASLVLAAAICALAVGCGGDKRTATTTAEHLQYSISVSPAGVGERVEADSLIVARRPLTRAAAGREGRAYTRRHLGVVAGPRSLPDRPFMNRDIRP